VPAEVPEGCPLRVVGWLGATVPAAILFSLMERTDFGRREPRCRICRDADIRSLVDDLLDWRSVPIFLSRRKFRRITLTEILRDLEPLNEGRDERHRISYDSLWVHAKRHYDPFGTPAYRSTRISVRLKNVLAGDGL
jgi:hypothetical protein